jgi:hypothetical protein
MNTAARFFEIIIRICGGGALILGLAFWLGYGRSFTQLHIRLGMAVVLSLWVLAGIAWKTGERASLVAFAAGWGALTWVLGVTQPQLWPGSLHWVVAVVHLLFGMIAIAVGSRLASAVGSLARAQSRARSIQWSTRKSPVVGGETAG